MPECQRQSRTDRWGEKAERKSVAPEQSRAEAKSHESRQIWRPGLSTRQRAGAVGTGSLGGEGMVRSWVNMGKAYRRWVSGLGGGGLGLRSLEDLGASVRGAW